MKAHWAPGRVLGAVDTAPRCKEARFSGSLPSGRGEETVNNESRSPVTIDAEKKNKVGPRDRVWMCGWRGCHAQGWSGNTSVTGWCLNRGLETARF